MTKEKDKQLLLADLYARLPYGVKITWNKEDWVTATPSMYSFICEEQEFTWKPYLRPISSMSLEELEEFRHFSDHIRDAECKIHIANYKQIDWLNAHHFDYRTDDEGKTMIEKGVALEAPKGMYGKEEQQ